MTATGLAELKSPTAAFAASSSSQSCGAADPSPQPLSASVQGPTGSAFHASAFKHQPQSRRKSIRSSFKTHFYMLLGLAFLHSISLLPEQTRLCHMHIPDADLMRDEIHEIGDLLLCEVKLESQTIFPQ